MENNGKRKKRPCIGDSFPDLTALAEQTVAIERFAKRWNLPKSKHCEKPETAAKIGRSVFLDMLNELRQGKA